MLGQVLQEYYIMLQWWHQQHLVDFCCWLRIQRCLFPRPMRTSQSHRLERLRINVISDFGCRSTHMDFQPLLAAFSGSPTWGSSPGIPCRRSFGSQGSMKACRKHITMKQKFLGSIPSGFQWILGESQGKTGRDASAFCLQNRK